MKAVVLAAGKGTRMKEITNDIPKPMVEVGGRPMLWQVLSSLARAGVSEAAVIVGYRADVIREYFGDGEDVGVRITYFTQETQDGTGRAADPARRFLGDSPFFFTFGDILTEPEAYRGMADAFTRDGPDLMLAVRRVDDPYKGAAVYERDGMIERLVEKPPRGTSTTNLINAGIFVTRPVLFDYTARLTLSERGEYEIPDAIRMMIADGLDVRTYRLIDYWRDVGTPEDLAAAGTDAEERDDLVNER